MTPDCVELLKGLFEVMSEAFKPALFRIMDSNSAGLDGTIWGFVGFVSTRIHRQLWFCFCVLGY